MLSNKEVKQRIAKIVSYLRELQEPKETTNMFKELTDFVAEQTILQLNTLLKEMEVS